MAQSPLALPQEATEAPAPEVIHSLIFGTSDPSTPQGRVGLAAMARPGSLPARTAKPSSAIARLRAMSSCMALADLESPTSFIRWDIGAALEPIWARSLSATQQS